VSAKTYVLKFGSGPPSSFSGLAPTFLTFVNSAGSATTAPSISEMASTGLYSFSYEALGEIFFVADGATTGLADNVRFVVGALDITDRVDQLIGSTSDAIGDDSTDPTTLFGFLLRAQNWAEGQNTYVKATGVLNMYEKTGATLLVSRTLADSTTNVTKS
jgi:hypothetical protein